MPPPAASCGFMCFPASSPHLHQGGVTGTWRRVLSLGLRQLAQMQNFGPRPPRRRTLPSGLAQVPEVVTGKEDRRRSMRTSGGRWAPDQSLEIAPGIAWVGGQPKFFRFYKCEAVSMSCIRARNYFQESAFRELIGPPSERGFYSSQSAVFKSVSFSAIGQSRRINSLKKNNSTS